MPVNAQNPVVQQTHNDIFTQPKSVSSSQANLFAKELKPSETITKLSNAANESGLSELASEGNEENWHSVMSQTFGYDVNDTDSDAYKISEQLREDVKDGNWAELDISVAKVTNGGLGEEAAGAAFVGGETAGTYDDQILIDGGEHESSSAAITEEIFHAFERKINPDQDGDTRLVNDVASFTGTEDGSVLDEGELGTTLLAGFMESGTVPTLSEVLAIGGIQSEDTSMVTLNGESGVSIEKAGVLESALAADDPSATGDIFPAVDATGLTEINEQFTNGMAVEHAADGTRNYYDMSGVYDAVTADIGGQGDPAAYLTNLSNPLKGGTQGIQDYLGYAARHDPAVGESITTRMSGGVGSEFLNNFSQEQLNNQKHLDNGILFNKEVLQHFPAEELLSLDDNKSLSNIVQAALIEKIESGDTGADEVKAALESVIAAGGLSPDQVDYLSVPILEVLGPRERSHDSLVPIDVGATDLQEKYLPTLTTEGGINAYTAVDADGNWSAGLPLDEDGDTSRTDLTQVIANTEELGNGITAIQYSYYFPKDPGVADGLIDGINDTFGDVIDEVGSWFGGGDSTDIPQTGHQHDWEDVIVYIQDAGGPNESVLGAAYSGHGSYTGTTDPNMTGNSVNVEWGYHPEYGISENIVDDVTGFAGGYTTHSFAEGAVGEGTNEEHTVVGWDFLSQTVQNTLNNVNVTNFHDFGSAVTPMSTRSESSDEYPWADNRASVNIMQGATAMGMEFDGGGMPLYGSSVLTGISDLIDGYGV